MSRLVDIPFSRQGGANRSRRARSGASWRAPLRRARRAIHSTLLRVETSGRVIDATARFAGRPLETSRRLHRLGHWIDEAGARLQRAVRGVEESVSLVAEEPHRAAGAPALLLDTTARLTADARLFGVWSNAVAPAQSLPVRHAPIRHAPVVLIRRRWLIIAFAAAAARNVSRGRAPPCDSTAHSSHCR